MNYKHRQKKYDQGGLADFSIQSGNNAAMLALMQRKIEENKSKQSMMGGGKVEYMEGGKVYKNGGKPDMDVKSLLAALSEYDKRGLNKLLNKQNRIDLSNDEEEGYNQLQNERDANRAERKRLNQEYREEMKSDDSGMEEVEGEGGGIDKENLKKILQALAAGGAGLGAMVGIPEIVKLLQRGKSGVESDALYHNVLDPMPDRPNIFLNRTPDQSSRGRGQ